MTTSQRTPDADVHPQFPDRWSPRALDPRPLTAAQISSLLEAMRWAPSCFNEQPWRVVYGAIGEPEHARIAGLLVDANRVWAERAPLLLVVFTHRVFARNGKPNRTAAFDAGAAWMSLALQARHLGLYAHGMAGYDLARSYTELGVPEAEYESLAAIAVGAPGDPQQLPESLRAKESPSGRNPQSDFAFHGTFKKEKSDEKAE